MLLTADDIGSSDCESIRDAWLAQPANSVSSLAFVVVGLAVALIAVRQRRAVVESVTYGGCVAAIGIGSVLFHGPQPDGSQLLHDLPIAITAVFVVAVDVALLWPRPGRPWATFLIGSTAATALTVVDDGLGAAATGLAIVAIVLLEFRVYRRQVRDTPVRRQLTIYGAIIAGAAFAALTWLLGRTGSPACDPDAEFQFHGLWHIVSAAVLGMWGWLAFGATAQGAASTTGRRGGDHSGSRRAEVGSSEVPGRR